MKFIIGSLFGVVESNFVMIEINTGCITYILEVNTHFSSKAEELLWINK